MQNFKNTEYENMTEEEIYLLNEKLIKATIRKKFPNYKSYCRVHMIDYEDLVQQGSLGLLIAIRTFDITSGASFRSHAINYIAWYISNNTRKESLRTINTRSSVTVDMVSVETKINSDEEMCILDTIESSSDTQAEVEDNVVFDRVIDFLKSDSEVNGELLYIFTARAKGKTMQDIADHFGCHRNSIAQKLRTQKAIRIKNRLKKHLENGEC